MIMAFNWTDRLKEYYIKSHDKLYKKLKYMVKKNLSQKSMGKRKIGFSLRVIGKSFGKKLY